jgi:GPH family glycoside/pentoside/hexuronide:cation symporter
MGRELAGTLATREKVGYALGDTASNLYWKVFEVYVLFYYTDVFGLSPSTLGTMMLLTRLSDAVADPVMGAIADRTTTRWGKFRPYLLWFSVPMAALGVLAFTTPPFGGTSRIAYAYATYTLMMLAYTGINIPYSALMGVMSSRSSERTALSTYRFIGAFAGGLFVQKCTLDLVRALGAGSASRGWPLTLALYGALSVALFAVCFATTQERVAAEDAPQRELRQDLADLLANRPWRVLFGVGVFVVASGFVRGSAAAYYFKYCVHREGLLGWFLVSGGVAAIAGVAATGAATRALGKRALYRGVLVAAAALTTVFYWVPGGCVWLLFVLNALIAFVLGPSAPLLWAMYADAADHSEWRTGRRATGLVFAAAIFALKLGAALGGWGLGELLEAFGYLPNTAQTPLALAGIRLVMSAIPGALLLVAAGTLWFYELDEPLVRRIERELAAARSATLTAAPPRGATETASIAPIRFDTNAARP